MTQTIRRRILDKIAETLTNPLYGMQKVNAFQPAAIDQGQWGDPQCFVWVQDDAAASGEIPDTAIQLESWRCTIGIEVYGRGDVEEYLGQIHKAMNADCQWGGLALDTYRRSSDTLEFDPARQSVGIRMMFTLYFRHANGDPYNLV